MRRGARCVIALVVMACAATLGARADADPAHGVSEGDGSALSGRRAAVQGAHSFLTLVVVSADVAIGDDDAAKLTKILKTQIEAYFTWASYGTMVPSVDLYLYRSPNSELEDDGTTCKTLDAMTPNPWDGDIEHAVSGDKDYEAKYDSFNSKKNMRQVLYLTNSCVGSCESGQNGISCQQKYSSLLACTNPDSTTAACDSTGIHEMLHAIGLKYHAGGYKCTQSDYDDASITWRTCPFEDYGGVFDVLGSSSDSYGKKMGQGVQSYSRWDMHWLSNTNVKVITKTNGQVTDDAPDVSKTCVLSPLDVDSTDSSTTRACVIQFSDTTMSSLGTIWLESRRGNKFDYLIVNGEHDGFNSLGVLGFHEGRKLIDFYPYDSSGGTDAGEKYNDWEQTALRSTENGGVWEDPVSGLKLTVDPFDGDTGKITVTVTFTQPAACVKRGAAAYPSQFNGYQMDVAYVDDDELEKYHPKNHLDLDGWPYAAYYSATSTQAISTAYYNQYIPYAPEGQQRETGVQESCYKLAITYKMSVQNLDYGVCAQSRLTVRALNLPAGWRVDAGACTNIIGAQGIIDDICFTVAVPRDTPDGAYEIRIQAAQINDSDKAVMTASETVPLLVCVGGFNYPYQSWDDTTSAGKWTCDYGAKGSKTRATIALGNIQNRAANTYEPSSTYYPTSNVAAAKSNRETFFLRNPEVTNDGADRLQDMSSLYSADEDDDRCYAVEATRYCGEDEFVWAQFWCAACPSGSTRPAGDDSWLVDGETSCTCPYGSTWTLGRCLCTTGEYYDSNNSCVTNSCGSGKYLSTDSYTCEDCATGYDTCTSASEGSTCSANYHVSDGTCVACGANSQNDAGDDIDDGNSQCDCDEEYSLVDGNCVTNSCGSGKYLSTDSYTCEDCATGYDTCTSASEGSTCSANYHVSDGTCVACGANSQNDAGDDIDDGNSQCDCDEEYSLVDGNCVTNSCGSGKYLSTDSYTCEDCATGYDTCTSASEGSTCSANYHVSDGTCVACGANSQNDAGDDIDDGNSQCDCDEEYSLVDGNCVTNSCGSGKYLSTDSYTCEDCATGYDTCTSASEGSTCSANYHVSDGTCVACGANSQNDAGDDIDDGNSQCDCDEEYSLVDGNCVTNSCGSGKYLSTDSYTCEDCATGYDTCTSASEGSTCSANYHVSDGTCVACGANSQNDAGDDIDDGNSQCDCDEEYSLVDGNCVTNSCGSGKYLSTDSYTCEDCATGYDTCTSASEGSTCSANYHVSDGTCVACGANSQNDAGDDIDDGNSQCDCDEEYSLVDGNCVTNSCGSGKYLSTDSYTCEDCATGYDTCTSASEGSTCSANYHVSDGTCVACGANSQNDAGDDIDDGNSQCDCDEEYSLVDGNCVTNSCGSGKYLSTDSYTCEDCATGYDTCTSASEGSTCSANYHVSDGTCVACGANSQNDAGDDIDDGNSQCDCDEEYSLVDGNCVTNSCGSGKYLSTDSYTCEDCATGYDTCTSASEGSTCSANYHVSDGTCVACGANSQNDAGDDIDDGNSQCDCDEEYSLVDGVCIKQVSIDVKMDFAGITGAIDTTLEQKLIDSLTSGIEGSDGFDATASEVAITYKISAKQTFTAAVDENAFKTAAASSLSVIVSDIINFSQTAARRRLLSNVVTYDVSTTNQATANSVNTAAAAAITVGGATGTPATPTTTLAFAVTYTVPSSAVSTVQSTVMSSSFTTSVNTAATTAGVSGVTVSVPPCNGIVAPTNGALGTCTTQLNNGESCVPVCNGDYELQGGPTMCVSGVLSAATCQAPSSSGGGSTPSPFDFGFSPANTIRFGVSSALIAAFTVAA